MLCSYCNFTHRPAHFLFTGWFVRIRPQDVPMRTASARMVEFVHKCLGYVLLRAWLCGLLFDCFLYFFLLSYEIVCCRSYHCVNTHVYLFSQNAVCLQGALPPVKSPDTAVLTHALPCVSSYVVCMVQVPPPTAADLCRWRRTKFRASH